MSMDEIVKYLAEHSLDEPTPDLDLYPHLTAAVKTQPVYVDDPAPKNDVVMPPDEELVDLPKAPVGEPLNFKASSAYDLPPKGDVLHENGAIVRPEFPFAPDDSSARLVDELFAPVYEGPKKVSFEEFAKEIIKAGKRGRKEQYDVSGLAVGDFIVYVGKGGLPSARVMASLKGRKSKEAGDDPVRSYQATQVGDEVRITRKR